MKQINDSNCILHYQRNIIKSSPSVNGESKNDSPRPRPTENSSRNKSEKTGEKHVWYLSARTGRVQSII
jgi:hypothetical protein